MEDLRPALQQVIEEWDRFDRALRNASVHTTRVRYSLQHPPLFSLRQAERHTDILEVRRGKIHVRKYSCFEHCHSCCSGDQKHVFFPLTSYSKKKSEKGRSSGHLQTNLARVLRGLFIMEVLSDWWNEWRVSENGIETQITGPIPGHFV